MIRGIYMKYAISYLYRTRNYISGREVIRELDNNKNESCTVYYRHSITNEIIPIISRDENSTIKIHSFSFCTNEMIKYIKKYNECIYSKKR